MRRRQLSSTQGFTIIEVLIVLAIAGLIALIVFQAIPVLTRGQRNGQRKDGASGVLRAVAQYELNNGGAMPASCSGAACTFTTGQHITFYRPNDVSVCVGSYSGASLSFGACSGVTSQPEATSIDTVAIYNYQRCDGAAGTSKAAGYSDVVAMFALESGSNATTAQCQEL